MSTSIHNAEQVSSKKNGAGSRTLKRGAKFRVSKSENQQQQQLSSHAQQQQLPPRPSVTVPSGPLPKSLRTRPVVNWSVDDVISWVKAIGLGQYASSFKESKVNGDSLVRLTRNQIRDVIGIKDHFHQRSLLSGQWVLLQQPEQRQSFSTWTCDEVVTWFEQYEVSQIRSVLISHAVHGGFLKEITKPDYVKMGIVNDLLIWKMLLLVNVLLLETERTRASTAAAVAAAAGGLTSSSTIQFSYSTASTIPAVGSAPTTPSKKSTVSSLFSGSGSGAAAAAGEPAFSSWKTAKVLHWLKSIGLDAYQQAFRTAGINGLCLLHLGTDQMILLGMVNELHQRSLMTGRLQLRVQAKKDESEPSGFVAVLKRTTTPTKKNKHQSQPQTKLQRVAQWPAAKVSKWLSKNDFGDKKEVFAANGVHGALLLELSEQDLVQHLGMHNVIERERLLRDIRQLAGITVSPTKRRLDWSSSSASAAPAHPYVLSGHGTAMPSAPPATIQGSPTSKRRRKSSDKRSHSGSGGSLSAAMADDCPVAQAAPTVVVAAAAAATTATTNGAANSFMTVNSNGYGRAPLLLDRRSPLASHSHLASSSPSPLPAVRVAESAVRTANAAAAAVAGHQNSNNNSPGLPLPILTVDAASSRNGDSPIARPDELMLHPGAVQVAQYSRLSLIRPPPPGTASGGRFSVNSSAASTPKSTQLQLQQQQQRMQPDSAGAAARPTPAPGICLSCQEQEASCVLDPCRHTVACLDCVSFLENCPACNEEIKSYVSVAYDDGDDE